MLKLFLNHLRLDKAASPHTVSAYERDLVQFEKTLEDRPLMEATELDIERYLKTLRKRDQKSTSIARKVSAIKQYYKFLIRENLREDNPASMIEAPVSTTRLPKTLSAETIDALLKTVDAGLHTQDPGLQVRDRAMLYLLYATGMRVSELLSFTLSQLDTQNGLVRVVGKRSKERVIPFAPIAGEHLLAYLEQVRPSFEPQSEVVFLGQGGSPLTRQAFWKTLKKIAMTSGLDASLHPHLLRHTFATDLLKSGMNLRSLQMLLGHADLQTTQVYTHVAPDHLQDVIARYHPRGQPRTPRQGRKK
jgi:integrase/recombinase XerD